jgi:hypothetical protein
MDGAAAGGEVSVLNSYAEIVFRYLLYLNSV